MRRINSLSRFLHLTLIIGAIFLLYACLSLPAEQINYPNHPRSILVMPPVNLSVDIDAPQTFLATSTYPLAEAGYYVIPVALSVEMFRENGVTIAEEAHAIPYNMLHEIFGAEAALYITITQYGAIYYIFGSAVTAEATARLVDLRSGELLWSGSVSVVETSSDSDSDSDNKKGLLAILLSAVVDQIVNTISNKAYTVGRTANHQLLSADGLGGILYGPYHLLYGLD